MRSDDADGEPIMKALRIAAAVMAVLAGLVVLVPTSAHAYYRGGYRGHWYGPSVGFYYGGPYYGYGWGSPWYYGSGYGYPYGYGGYGYGYGGYYAQPSYLYGPPAVAYIERDQPVTSTLQLQPQARTGRPGRARRPVVVPVQCAARRLPQRSRVPGRMGARAGDPAGPREVSLRCGPCY